MSGRTGPIVFAVLAVGLIALAIFTIVKTSNQGSEVSDLKTQIDALESQVASVETETAKVAKDTGASAAEELLAVERRLKKLETCIPEVQNEINSLEIEAKYAYIENNASISTYCQKVFYPPAEGEH